MLRRSTCKLSMQMLQNARKQWFNRELLEALLLPARAPRAAKVHIASWHFFMRTLRGNHEGTVFPQQSCKPHSSEAAKSYANKKATRAQHKRR
jgi:hypothetical protein